MTGKAKRGTQDKRVPQRIPTKKNPINKSRNLFAEVIRKLRDAIETQMPIKSGIYRLLINQKNGFKKRREAHNRPCTEFNFR